MYNEGQKRRAFSGWIAVRVALGVALLIPGLLAAQPLGSAFTYQGQLSDEGEPAQGVYDLQVCLFDTASGPIPLDCAPDFDDLAVQQGIFSITLDFGAEAFDGQQRWLELRVRPGASMAGYTILSPRQRVRPAPEALRANVAETAAVAMVADAANSAPWSGLTGVPGDFADGVDNDSGGTVTTITAGTGLSGGTITGSGTIGIAEGGVGALQLADGAVGLAQIDTDQVQARILGGCPAGQYLRAIGSDGTPICNALPEPTRSVLLDGLTQDAGRHSSIAIGEDGFPVIAYRHEGQNQLRLARCVDAGCENGAHISILDIATQPSLRIGPDGFPVVSFYDAFNGQLKLAKCNDSNCEPPVTLSVVDDGSQVGSGSSLALDASGNPVIGYSDLPTGAIRLARCVNAACAGSVTSIAVVEAPQFGSLSSTSLVIGTDGFPMLAYRDGHNQSLRVAKCTNVSCTSPPILTTIDEDGNTGLSPAMLISGDGLPVIAYVRREFGDGSWLRVAACVDPACEDPPTISDVDTGPGGVGTYVSITLASDGLPIIAYNVEDRRVLKVLKCGSPDCSTGNQARTIDRSTTGVGTDNSMAIGIDGRPVISHFNFDSNSLRLTRCGTVDCL